MSRVTFVRRWMIVWQRDNVIVALPYHYEQADFDIRMWYARWSVFVAFFIQAVNAVSFFGGFSTFDTALSLFHLCFHSVSGLLIALTVINKGHFLYLWYIVLVLGSPQLLADVWTLFSLLIIGRKRRW